MCITQCGIKLRAWYIKPGGVRVTVLHSPESILGCKHIRANSTNTNKTRVRKPIFIGYYYYSTFNPVSPFVNCFLFIFGFILQIKYIRVHIIARRLAGSDNDKSSNESTTDFNESTKHSNRLLRSSIHFYILIGEGQPSHVFETVLQLTACN